MTAIDLPIAGLCREGRDERVDSHTKVVDAFPNIFAQGLYLRPAVLYRFDQCVPQFAVIGGDFAGGHRPLKGGDKAIDTLETVGHRLTGLIRDRPYERYVVARFLFRGTKGLQAASFAGRKASLSRRVSRRVASGTGTHCGRKGGQIEECGEVGRTVGRKLWKYTHLYTPRTGDSPTDASIFPKQGGRAPL